MFVSIAEGGGVTEAIAVGAKAGVAGSPNGAVKPVRESARDRCWIRLFAVSITSTSDEALPVIATAWATADWVAIETSTREIGGVAFSETGAELCLDWKMAAAVLSACS